MDELKYTIAAKPTRYGGIMFRSRLEARWAAFFDLVGWKWDYEPLDLYEWVPDFILHGAKEKVAVEVKPIFELSEMPADQFEKFKLSGWSGDILILGGRGPVENCKVFGDCLKLGWLDEAGSQEPNEERTFYFEGATLGTVGGDYDFWHCYQTYNGRMTGLYEGDHYLERLSDYELKEIRGFWAKSLNLTQWHPTKPTKRKRVTATERLIELEKTYRLEEAFLASHDDASEAPKRG